MITQGTEELLAGSQTVAPVTRANLRREAPVDAGGAFGDAEAMNQDTVSNSDPEHIAASANVTAERGAHEATVQDPEPGSGSDVSFTLERIETIPSTLANAISFMQEGQTSPKLPD